MTRIFLISILFGVLTACAQQFPRPVDDNRVSGSDIFDKTFMAHGGGNLHSLENLTVQLDGEWKYWITKIQPLVTDHRYRVRSQERLFPRTKEYIADYHGPAGSKRVHRTRDSIRVFYNEVESVDHDVLASTALTADAFFLFLLGPLSLIDYRDGFVHLDDIVDNNRIYHRIYLPLRPGIGFSEADELVLWVDRETFYTYRMQITLEGYKTTQGAHVDVTYLNYNLVDGFVFPQEFFERVLAPISIDAHYWRAESMEVNAP